MSFFDDLDLPASVLELPELIPIEDIMLKILREGLPDISVWSLIPDVAVTPFVLVRRKAGMGDWSGDARFTDEGHVAIGVFTKDPDGDLKCSVLSEAVRVILRRAWLEHWSDPDLGSIISLKMTSEPSRQADWATSSGPVQYADLPAGHWRYESSYSIKLRKPRRH